MTVSPSAAPITGRPPRCVTGLVAGIVRGRLIWAELTADPADETVLIEITRPYLRLTIDARLWPAHEHAPPEFVAPGTVLKVQTTEAEALILAGAVKSVSRTVLEPTA